MLGRATLAATVVIGLGSAAQACQPNYIVQSGDTLFTIAERQLGDLTKWSSIFRNNPSLEGTSLLDVAVGTVLQLPCPAGSVTQPQTVIVEPSAQTNTAAAAPQPEPAPAVTEAVQALLVPQAAPEPTPEPVIEIEPVTLLAPGTGINLVTGPDYAPFTDLGWEGRGMLTELVEAALDESPSALPYTITWERDWSKHLFPMLDSTELDMGFPWFKPDCVANPANERCANFHFSDPLVELVIVLFTKADNQFPYKSDADLQGKVLCRPGGGFTNGWGHEDRQRLVKDENRRLLTDGIVTLEQPETAEQCFEMLMKGDVDAVAMNEFLGIRKIYDMGLKDLAVPLSRPLSVEGLHVIISKKNWRATTHLYRFNAGLAKLRQSDRYHEIVSRHLELFWSQLQG